MFNLDSCLKNLLKNFLIQHNYRSRHLVTINSENIEIIVHKIETYIFRQAFLNLKPKKAITGKVKFVI